MLTKWLLAFYPLAWRERYEEEMLALMEQHSVTFRTVIDLLCGAMDARFDPFFRSCNLTAAMVARRMRRAYSAIFWAFPLLIVGYMYFLDGLDDALYNWNRANLGLWHFKLGSEVAMAVALIAFLLTALVSFVALLICSRISEKVLRYTLPAIGLVVLGMLLHILYTGVWGCAIWNLPASTIQAMAQEANRHIWSGEGWHLQIVGGILWMSLLTGYILHCLWQSFYRFRQIQTAE